MVGPFRLTRRGAPAFSRRPRHSVPPVSARRRCESERPQRPFERVGHAGRHVAPTADHHLRPPRATSARTVSASARETILDVGAIGDAREGGVEAAEAAVGEPAPEVPLVEEVGRRVAGAEPEMHGPPAVVLADETGERADAVPAPTRITGVLPAIGLKPGVGAHESVDLAADGKVRQEARAEPAGVTADADLEHAIAGRRGERIEARDGGPRCQDADEVSRLEARQPRPEEAGVGRDGPGSAEAKRRTAVGASTASP